MLLNFHYLNEMIKYIEDNLDKEIDFNELKKITHSNLFILERIFMFLTNMTITEYIKKRRLSKAFEEIKNTNHKIIDIAFKYQYNSSPSFNRAFKQLFNITPTECRKGAGNYKIIPIEYFEVNKEKYNFDYEIKKLNSIFLYCYHVKAEHHSDLLFKIKQLYQEVKINGVYNIFNESGMYGIFLKDENSYHYYLGSTKYFPDLEKYEIKKSEYAEFKLISRKQSKIVAFEEKINKQWIPSTNYSIKNNLKIELYKDDNCFIYLPIK
jgi:AraC family transcriptional regulator